MGLAHTYSCYPGAIGRPPAGPGDSVEGRRLCRHPSLDKLAYLVDRRSSQKVCTAPTLKVYRSDLAFFVRVNIQISQTP